jgi:hypothetical protein
MARTPPLKSSGPPAEVLTPASIDPKHLTARQNNGAIPPSARGTISGMTSEAMDAESAGADGVPPQTAATAPGSNKSIPAPYRDAICTPASVHIP